jgi:hypothetical protein
MTRPATIPRQIRATAPWLSLLLLAALSQALPNRVTFDERTAARQAEIKAAMETAPFIIGDWMGQQPNSENDVPREAQKLLRPNAILNRWYRQPGGIALHLLVVHCSDARDMLGHYPPICYPSSGWVDLPMDGEVDTFLAVGDHRLPVRAYKFRRVNENGTETSLRIFNAFVLPDGTVTRDIGAINRQSERLAVSVKGVAQVQVISAAGVSAETAAAAAGDLLAGLDDLLAALGVGQGETHDP